MDAPLGRLTWPLRTERLLLRPMTEADVPSVFGYRKLPAVSEWIGGLVHDLDDLARRFFDPESATEQLVVERDGVVIGDLMLDVQDAWGQREVAERARRTQGMLGWTFHPDHHGQGYATEAVAELIRICFEDLGLRRIEAECFAANEPSWRLMERLGMRREIHAVAESLHRDHGWVDGFGYALLADEWLRSRDRPRTR